MEERERKKANFNFSSYHRTTLDHEKIHPNVIIEFTNYGIDPSRIVVATIPSHRQLFDNRSAYSR